MTARPPNYGVFGPIPPFSTTSSSPSAINTTTSSITFRAAINGVGPLALVPADGKTIESYVKARYDAGDHQAALFFDDHLHYEIEMLSLAVVDIQTLSEDVVARAAQDNRLTFPYSVNRAIEQVCLHARNLAEFLARDKDSMKKRMFPERFTTDCFKPLERGGLSESLFIKIQNQVSHLNNQRTIEETRKISTEMCVTEIAPKIFEGVLLFERHLKDEFRPLWRCEVRDTSPKIGVKPRLGQ